MSPRNNLVKPRDPILEAATDLFSESGYTGTTIRDIATVVGVLPGSLYAHIANKETLLLEIVETGIDRFLAVTASLDPTASPVELMRLAIKAHVDVVAENPPRTLVVFHQWRYLTGSNRARIVDKRRRYDSRSALLGGHISPHPSAVWASVSESASSSAASARSWRASSNQGW
jgi:AcrR family transcriptional regulator